MMKETYLFFEKFCLLEHLMKEKFQEKVILCTVHHRQITLELIGLYRLTNLVSRLTLGQMVNAAFHMNMSKRCKRCTAFYLSEIIAPSIRIVVTNTRIRISFFSQFAKHSTDRLDKGGGGCLNEHVGKQNKFRAVTII
jgi:hypothetical protein